MVGEAPQNQENNENRDRRPREDPSTLDDLTYPDDFASRPLPIDLVRLPQECRIRERQIKELAEKGDRLKADISIGQNVEENKSKLIEIAQQMGSHADDAFQDWARADATVLANRRKDSLNPEPGYEQWNDRLQATVLQAWTYTQQAFDQWTEVLDNVDKNRADAIRRSLEDRKQSAQEQNRPEPPLQMGGSMEQYRRTHY